VTFESDEFLELMPHEVTVAKVSSRNSYGEVTYGAASAPIRARVVRKARMVRTDSGDEAVSSAHAWLAGAPGVTTADKVTLPDGTAPPIIAVERYPDEDGDHHELLLFA